MTALGLCCCKRVLSGCSKRVPFFIVVHRLLTAVASLTAEKASVVAAHGPSSCGLWAYLPCGMWDLPGLGIKPTSPALAGGFLTAGPQVRSSM